MRMSQSSDLYGQVRYEPGVRKEEGAGDWAHLSGPTHKARQRLHCRLMFKPATRPLWRLRCAIYFESSKIRQAGALGLTPDWSLTSVLCCHLETTSGNLESKTLK